jgi:protein tyrosine/serine phosphatase
MEQTVSVWNFRDISKYNSKIIQSGKIYRTSSLTRYQKENGFEGFLKQNHITQILDLRADREIEIDAYNADSLKLFKYVNTPFDPWNQSIAFQNTHNTGTNAEIAYHFFMMECKFSIKRVMESLLSNPNDATAIHCHAGKDRTGIIIIMLHLLAGASENDILTDYLASEMDTNKILFGIVSSEIEKQGGIQPYLLSCDLSNLQIQSLKKQLML